MTANNSALLANSTINVKIRAKIMVILLIWDQT